MKVFYPKGIKRQDLRRPLPWYLISDRRNTISFAACFHRSKHPLTWKIREIQQPSSGVNAVKRGGGIHGGKIRGTMTLLAASIVAHVRCATPFLLNLFRSCTLLIAAMPKGLASSATLVRLLSFRSQVTYSCIICYGFHTGHNSTDISSTRVKPHPLPPSSLDATPQSSFPLRALGGGGGVLLTLNLRPIHRNESKRGGRRGAN